MKQFYKNTETPIPAIAFADSAPFGFTLVTDIEEKKRLFYAKYEQRRDDGQNFYTEMQVDLYNSILDGTYTSDQVFEFEEHTSQLGDQIFKGDWFTAQSTCFDLPTSGIFDTVKKAEIQGFIDAYVLEDY